MMIRGICRFSIVVLLCFFSFTAFSQIPLTMATGVQPFGSFDGNPDVINLGDLNVHWSFPVVHKAGRGINFDYSLSYDSGMWTNNGVWSPIAGGWSGVGPSTVAGSLSYSETLWGGNGCLDGVANYPAGLEDYNYVYVDSLGNQHWFGSGAYTQQCYSGGYAVGSTVTNGFPVIATDGSGIKLLCNGCTAGTTKGFTIVLPSGQSIAIGQVIPSVNAFPNVYIQDSNGNYLSWNGGSVFGGWNVGFTEELEGYLIADPNSPGSNPLVPVAGLPAYTDTLGTQVMSTTAEGFWDEFNSPGPPDGTWAYYQPDGKQDGTGNIADANITMSVLGASYTITNTPSEIATAFGCPNVAEYDSGPVGVTWSQSGSLIAGIYNYANLVTNLQMQDGSSYSLSYQPTQPGSSSSTGMLSSVVFPHGGSISYHYGPINCSDGSVSSLTRTVNDGNGDGNDHSFTWTYQRSYLSASSQWQTVVTDPYGNQTVHLFVIGNTGAIPAELVGDLYVPAASQGTNNFYEVSKTVYSGPVSNGVVLQATNTCYNGNTTGAYSASCTTPLPFTYPITSVQTSVTPNGGSLTGATVQLFNAVGLPTESDVYDYGTTSGQVGALLSRTTTTYAAAGQILNKPSAVTQYDGAGNVLSSTSYTYDEGQVIEEDGVPNHTDYVPNSPTTITPIVNSSRGNLTTITQGTGSTTLTSHYTYYDTGQVATSTDVNGATVTYNYTQCGGSLLGGTTQTVQPSGITLSTSQTWNCDGGVVVSATDVNGNTTTTNYVDPFWRPTITVDPLGNTTHITYPTASSNSSTVLKTYAGNLPSSSSVTTYDGLGRTILTQVQQGPGSSTYSSSAQSYDPFGHVAWSYAPYSAPAGAYITTGPGTNTVYDALGRPQIITDAGGGKLSYTYNLNDTMITQGPAASGESVKARQLEYNIAGQLTSVCEITSGTASGVCGQSSSSTGYWTTYKYSGSLLSGVSQNVQAGPSATQTRSINYDVLGRKISETIPETGTSKFFYDTAGNMFESIDNAGNTTSMAYDSLHRLTSSQIVSGPSATVTGATTYVYDAATLNGTPMQNALGTLAAVHEWSCPVTNCVDTDIYKDSYFETSGGQKTGRTISQMWESTPNSNGYILTQSISNANGTPATLSASLNGASVGFPNMVYGLDTLGRPATATDITNNLSLLTSTSYNPATGAVTGLKYGNGDTDGFGYDPNTGRPTSFAYSIGGPNSFAISGGLTWNPNGSLQNFQMIDYGDHSKDQNCQYTMDDINRLASVNCVGSLTQNFTGWAQSFTYDPFGNINKSGPASPSQGQYTLSYMPAYNSVNNQVISGPPAAYDQNGNQTIAETNNFTWNALGQPINVNGVGAIYDGLGRMVETDSYNLHTVAATGSTGSITIAGSEQVIPATKPYQATTTITITGGPDQSMPINLQTTSPNGCVPVVTGSYPNATCWDVGGGDLVVLTYQVSNGEYLSASEFSLGYSNGSTVDSIADALAAEINADTSVGYTATPLNNGSGQMTLVLQSTNSSPVYYEVLTGMGCGDAFPACSFGITGPSGTIAASQSGTYTAPISDAGTISVSINNGAPISYPWSSGDTPTSIADYLANQIAQNYGSIISVSQVVSSGNSATISLSSLFTGAATNYSITESSTDDNYQEFHFPSFSAGVSGMSGGADSYSTGPLTGTTQYVYSPSGTKIAILQNGQLVKGTVPLPGGGTAVYNSSGLAYLRHKDWLGSSRLATTWNYNTYSKEAYAPFGEAENNLEAGTPDRSFTGQDQDTSSGIFDYLFRKYDPVSGRWLSPDPSGWTAFNPAYPQSLNRYTYVQNNPMSLTDPNGLECVWSDGTYDSEDDPDTGSVGQCQGEGGTWIELGRNGNWNGDPNDPSASNLAKAVQNIQNGIWSTVSVIGLNGSPNITSYNSTGLVTLTDTGGGIVHYDGSQGGIQVGGWETDSGYAAQIQALGQNPFSLQVQQSPQNQSCGTSIGETVGGLAGGAIEAGAIIAVGPEVLAAAGAETAEGLATGDLLAAGSSYPHMLSTLGMLAVAPAILIFNGAMGISQNCF